MGREFCEKAFFPFPFKYQQRQRLNKKQNYGKQK